jgi:hypothetical protein
MTVEHAGERQKSPVNSQLTRRVKQPFEQSVCLSGRLAVLQGSVQLLAQQLL